MKKLFRYLLGGKGALPPPQRRSVAAHELALKAVARRLGEKAKREASAEAPVMSELPVVTQLVSVDKQLIEPGAEKVPAPRPKQERRGERRQLRRKNLARGQVASADEGAAGQDVARAPLPRPKQERRSERRRLRRKQDVATGQVASAGQEAVVLNNVEAPPRPR